MSNKTTKRALLASALSLLLCVAMLAGTTFAWFTDSVVSSGNIIKAGNLNIDLGIKAKGDDDYVSVKANPTKAAFDYDLWEPGYTEWVNAKVFTTGNLALKYTMNIVANGEVSALADVIDVYYASREVTKPANRDLSGLTRLGTLADALNGTVAIHDTLIPGTNEEDFATLALHMQETAGNDYQGLSIGTTFSIQILATQYTYEEDSFDDQYDASALLPTTVGSYASMSTLLSSVDASEPVAIQLTNNIVVPDDAEKSAISIPANANVTLDLNGHTISGGRSDQKPNYGMINVGMNATLTIENGTVTYGDDGDSSFSAYRNTISIQRGTLVIKNATINNTCQAGISSAIDIMSNTGAEDAKLIIENSTINSTRYGIRLFGNSVTGSAILEMKNTIVNASSSAIFLHQPASNKKGLIEATVTDSQITGRSGVYVWDCGNTASVDGDNIKLVLNGSTTLTSTGTYAEKTAAIANHSDGYYPGFGNQIVVDYSTGAGDTNLAVTDNR